MSTMLKRSILPLLLAAAMLATAPTANAQSGEDAKADAKAEKKMLVKVMSIENGDTTVTEHEVDPNDSEVSWVEKDDDGKEKHILIKKELSGPDSKHGGMACCEAKESAEKKECAGKDCCAMDKDGHHGKAEMKKMMKMHGDMDSKEMKEMHEKMSSKEMKEMHKQMMKERKEKDADGDEDADTDETEDKDDDDGVNRR